MRGAILKPRLSKSDGEAAVNTCERCGADAVDARGICQHCGWQGRSDGFSDTTGAPSLGETRAADVAPLGMGLPSRAPNAGQGSRGWASSAASNTPVSNPSATRFCGTCGARI